MSMLRKLLVSCLVLLVTLPAWGVDEAALELLASDDYGDKVAAIDRIANGDDSRALPVLDALLEGRLRVDGEGRGWIDEAQGSRDALSGKAVPLPSPEPALVAINNRLRGRLITEIARLRLQSPDRALRLAAAGELRDSVDEKLLPALQQAAANEKDSEILALLQRAMAGAQLRSDEPAQRLAGVRALSGSGQASTVPLLSALLQTHPDGSFVEPDGAVRDAARAALGEVERRLARAEWFGQIFAGLSLGSILMLAAMGLAVTFGLLGVINMAHGEMIMIGAYAAYVTQALFRSFLPEAFAWYPIAALPVAFLAAALIGIAIERTVIRWLYGRPLETLLATWGVSLILIQAVRQVFGPQNVGIENPAWLSGGVSLAGVVLPYNRIAIIVFSVLVLAAVVLLLQRTRLGLFVRGVTQNRSMASAVGVPTGRVDMLAFGLGSGIAGLAGVALSQVGNVGPELGQAYIIDSFIVVVLGGVGQLFGTVVAGFGLGVVNKLFEPWLGAVIAKILILALVVAFIQKRPSGLFAMKGRMVEN
jgi:urea transport system permease protein